MENMKHVTRPQEMERQNANRITRFQEMERQNGSSSTIDSMILMHNLLIAVTTTPIMNGFK